MKRTNLMYVLPLTAAIIAVGAISHADPVMIPRGVEVPLVFDQKVSSKTAKAGDTIRLHVAHDVMYDGHVVIRRGAHVIGVVTDVEHRKNFGVNAKLRLGFDSVKSTYGKLIDLEAKNKGKYTGSRADHAAEISGGAAIVLGPIGLVGGYFVVGKQITVKPGDHIVTEVVHDTVLGS